MENVLPKKERCGMCRCVPMKFVHYDGKIFCKDKNRKCLEKYKAKHPRYFNEGGIY